MARRSLALAVALVAIGCRGDDTPTATPAPSATLAPTPGVTKAATPASATSVMISGRVIDQATARPVPDVQVVLLGSDGELATATNAAGEFAITVVPGTYRAFVRSPSWLTMGRTERVRLDNSPRRELVGALDVAIVPALDARTNLEHIELGVARAIELTGTVLNPDGREIADAVVRLRDANQLSSRVGVATRPVLGTDLAITDERGRFTLHAPIGTYALDATHPSHAGVRGDSLVELLGSQPVQQIALSLQRGCIITGRVVNADGSPAPDGAIERLGARADGFGPSGRIDAGAFRWVTTETSSVTLRAWPWHSPPSPSRTFDCRDGKRYSDVVFRLPEQRPDLSGTIVDANDRPVPLAYLDIQPLDPIVSGQQERGDAAGTWHVYDMPAARYRITAAAPGQGIVDTMVIAPRHDLRLALGGTGRIVGTTTELVTGSVEVSFRFCGSNDQPLQIAHEPRIVPVVGGRFTIDRAPACTLSLAFRWRDKSIETSAVVEPERTAYVELDIGEPRAKTITGTVRDVAGKGIEGARVTAVLHEREAATVRTDAKGRYTLQTHSGAQLVAGKGEHVGRGHVGRANVTSEQIDLVLDDADY